LPFPSLGPGATLTTPVDIDPCCIFQTGHLSIHSFLKKTPAPQGKELYFLLAFSDLLTSSLHGFEIALLKIQEAHLFPCIFCASFLEHLRPSLLLAVE
ncbi:hypothetical protein AAIH16_41725, partial [Pseudomonas aeruginosa]